MTNRPLMHRSEIERLQTAANQPYIADITIRSQDLRDLCRTALAQAERIAELEQRSEAAEALNTHLDLAVRKAEGASEAIRRRAEAAEAELARRDAVPPVAWTDEEELRSVERDGSGGLFSVNPITPNADHRRVIKLYTDAQRAVLPPEPNAEMQAAGAAAIRFDTTVVNKLFTANAVWRAMVAALGLKPQVVKLPKAIIPISGGWGEAGQDVKDYRDEVIEAIRAAGLEVEE